MLLNVIKDEWIMVLVIELRLNVYVTTGVTTGTANKK